VRLSYRLIDHETQREVELRQDIKPLGEDQYQIVVHEMSGDGERSNHEVMFVASSRGWYYADGAWREEVDGVRPLFFEVDSWRVIVESRPGGLDGLLRVLG
jgi:hypothetical protein